MDSLHTKRQLSTARRSLIEVFQRVNYGRIEGLTVRCGEPVLDPMPRVIHEYKFQSDNGPRPETRKPDFLLKRQVIEFLERLDEIHDGVIPSIEIQRGLPFRMTVEETLA